MNYRAYVAEFVGTFALLFVAVGAVASDHVSGGVGLLGIALANGMIIAAMATAVGPVSGGHFNPAVTIGLLCARKIGAVNSVGYVVSQCLGGVVGVLVIRNVISDATLRSVRMGTPALAEGVTRSEGLILEIVLTFLLVFVIYGTAVDKRAPRTGALFVGLAVAFGILAGGPFTGGAMNPARHLGSALLGGGLDNLWLYWTGPIVGGVAAALLYRHVLEQKS